ncbi:MAG: serine/threonine-protein phosphatase 6 regulatory ankyrin repeat subunit C-like, partial [Francisellaceae bacterium]|nr:serine/threonine-protein phosphatase 6 regulatory ankyrin repeat subunit C-like [Francisellaceae bacterium]
MTILTYTHRLLIAMEITNQNNLSNICTLLKNQNLITNLNTIYLKKNSDPQYKIIFKNIPKISSLVNTELKKGSNYSSLLTAIKLNFVELPQLQLEALIDSEILIKAANSKLINFNIKELSENQNSVTIEVIKKLEKFNFVPTVKEDNKDWLEEQIERNFLQPDNNIEPTSLLINQVLLPNYESQDAWIIPSELPVNQPTVGVKKDRKVFSEPYLSDELRENFIKKLNKQNNIKVDDLYNFGLLHEAARQNDLPLIKLLVDYGFDVNEYNLYQKQPIYYAEQAEENHLVKEEVLDYLTKKMKETESKVYSVLFAANQGKDIQSVLKAQGISLWHKTTKGFTPLFLALLKDELESAKRLIESGAEVDQENGFQHIRAISIPGGDNPGINTKRIKLLVEAGAALDKYDYNGFSILHKAASYNSHGMIPWLIDQGIPIEVRTISQKNTALHFAVSSGSFEAVQQLIAKGASLEAINIFGETPLHMAVKEGHLAITNYLIKKKADITRLNIRSGLSALHYAVEQNHKEIINSLLTCGVDCNLNSAKFPPDSAINKPDNSFFKDTNKSKPKSNLEDNKSKPKSNVKINKPNSNFKPCPERLLNHPAENLINAYNTLGLRAGTSLKGVEKQFKILSLQYHPDKNINNFQAIKRYQQLVKARDTIIDHEVFKLYPMHKEPYEPGYTPLSYAILKGYSSVAFCLLQQGASLETVLSACQEKDFSSDVFITSYKSFIQLKTHFPPSKNKLYKPLFELFQADFVNQYFISPGFEDLILYLKDKPYQEDTLMGLWQAAEKSNDN